MTTISELPFLGHEQVWERFRKSFSNDRLASTYLFVGTAGIGKRTVAARLAQTLLCEGLDQSFSACGHCSSCKLVVSGNHPDLITIAKPEGKNFIPLELLIGDREHRRRQGLCHDINLTPYYGQRKVAIIDDADHLNMEGANCLLKTLEEPPDKSILILIGTSEHRQLPTILSRSQIIRFQDLTNEQLTLLLAQQELNDDVAVADLVHTAGGSIQLAIKLSEKELFDFRSKLLGQLGSADPAADGFSKELTDFVDSRHKDAAARREEYSLIADMAIGFFETAMRMAVTSNPSSEDESLLTKIQSWLDQTSTFDAGEIAADSIERTEQFKFQVAANLSAANIVPAWLNDIGAIARAEKSHAQ